MNAGLMAYIKKHFPELSTTTWSEEAVSMDGEELFEDGTFQTLFENKCLDTMLYYPIEINSAILPFEIYEEKTLIALGYMTDDTQNIIFLKHDTETLVNLL